MFIRWCFPIALMFVCVTAVAQEEGATHETPDDVAAQVRIHLDRSVEMFEVSSDRENDLTMTPKPVQRWTNDERDSHSNGLLVLWIDRGLPAASMATYSWSGRIYREFDILSRQPVVMKQGTSIVWRPKSGLTFQPVTKAPTVASTPAARLRQMKLLSEDFSATMVGWRADNSDRAELRRLPRELYRYEPAEGSEVMDGAVFAFVLGTDPEALLLIEAVAVNEQPEWQYAYVRQTSGGLEGRHADQVVWKAERYPRRNASTGLGFTLPGEELKTERAR